MEELKPLSEITAPDVRNTYFVVRDGKLSLEAIHQAVHAITLSEYVPEDIRTHFSQAQNLAVYSWFHYPFNVTAQFMGFVTVEFALKKRLESKANFKDLIVMAAKRGLIKDEGFAIANLRESAEKSYVETLSETMPSLRNRIAHGSNMLHNNSISSLQICADFINQLYPKVQGAA